MGIWINAFEPWHDNSLQQKQNSIFHVVTAIAVDKNSVC